MWRLETTDPPQNGPAKPGSSMSVLLAFIRAATQGQLTMFDFSPFVILFWNSKEGDIGETPHSEEPLNHQNLFLCFRLKFLYLSESPKNFFHYTIYFTF